MDKDLVPEFVYDDAYRKKHKVPTADSNTKYFSGWRICGIPAVNDALKGCQSKSDVIVSDFCHAKGRGEGVYGFSTRKDPNHRLVVTGATYSIYDECKLTWDGLVKPQMAFYEEDMCGDTNIQRRCREGARSGARSRRTSGTELLKWASWRRAYGSAPLPTWKGVEGYKCGRLTFVGGSPPSGPTSAHLRRAGRVRAAKIEDVEPIICPPERA